MDEPTAESDTFAESAQRVVDYLNTHTPLSDWSVSRIVDGEQVHLHVHPGFLLHAGDRVPLEDTFCRRMLAGAPAVVADASRSNAYADLAGSSGVAAYAGVRLVDDDGTTFGTLCGVGADPIATPDRIDRDLLAVFASLLSNQLRLVRLRDADRHTAVLAEALASTDALTGLMNRRGWDLVVADAQRRLDDLGDQVGVILIDLDGLKRVNDTEGHQAGDALLVRAAEALSGASRDVDRVARYGGDEFAVCLADVSAADLQGTAERYAAALAEVGIAASVGSAPGLVGEPGTGMRRAVAAADASMYAAKVARRDSRADPAAPPR